MGNTMTKTEADFILLLSAAINSVKLAPERVKQMELSKLCQMASEHRTVTAIFNSLAEAGAYEQANFANLTEDGQKALLRLKEHKEKALRKVLMLDAKRQEIFHELDLAGIWHMPLKGAVLKDIYPLTGMREMSDNDILFDAKHQADVRDIMVRLGFKVEEYQQANHDVYQKKPLYNYEMHTRLFFDIHDDKWSSYYDNIEERLLWDKPVGDDGTRTDYGRHMNVNDAYNYMITHEFKHWEASGTGIRSLMDLTYYLRKYDAQMDWDYIEAEGIKLGIDAYEKGCRALAEKLFSKVTEWEELLPGLSEEEVAMAKKFVVSGVHGTLEQAVDKMMKQQIGDNAKVTTKEKIKYLYRRIFPGFAWFRKNFPLLDRHPWMIPFYAFYRMTVRAFLGRKYISKEIKTVKKMENGDK